MNGYIYKDEWYPVLMLTITECGKSPIPDKVVKKYNKLMKDFDKMQEILFKLYTKMEKND